MFNVFIPYDDAKVWKQVPRLDLLLVRLRAKVGKKPEPRRELQTDFEEWAVRVMTFDWGLLKAEDGMVFQFEQRRQAIYFKLLWD